MIADISLTRQDDPADRAPAQAREKLIDMRYAAKAANLLARDLGDEISDLRDQKAREERRLRDLSSGRYARVPQEQLAAQKSKVDILAEKIARLQARYDTARAHWETAADALNRVRARIDELRIELRMIETAPFPSSIVKSKMRSQIAAMAEAGEPDVMGSIEGGGQIEFRKAFFAPQLVKGTDGQMAGTVDFRDQIDLSALIAWLLRDQLITALERKIDENSDDASALDDATRKKKTDRARAEILAAEREEESLVELAHSHGLMIARRDDADPRAVLGVVGREPKDLFR